MRLSFFVSCWQLISLVHALNILISSKDSWVSKNTRFLYQSLKEQNHTVILTAPLYHDFHSSSQHKKRSDASASNNGGDFGHLLPDNQTFYKNTKKIATLPKSAKRVIRKRDSDLIDQEIAETITTPAYGQDPLNHDVWYIDNSPLQSLLIAFDVILPTHYPHFKPDLVILGPNEGLSLNENAVDLDLSFDDDQQQDSLLAMTKLTQLKGFPVLTVSLQDDHHIYYQDEHYFKIQQRDLKSTLRRNVICQNIEFVNNKIHELINSMSNSFGQSSQAQLAINLNFPSMNFDRSRCSTTNSGFSANQPLINPQFSQIVSPSTSSNPSIHHFNKVDLPRFKFDDQQNLIINGHYQITLDEDSSIHSSLSSDDDEPSTFVDKRSYYYQQKVKLNTKLPEVEDTHSDDEVLEMTKTNGELNALKHCMIAVSVGHVKLGNGLGTDVFDLQSIF